MKIRYEKAAIKYLKGLQQSQRDLILSAIEKLTHHPAEGDIKPMAAIRMDDIVFVSENIGLSTSI